MKLLTFKNRSQALKGNQEKDVGLRTNKLLSYETTGKRKGLTSFSVQRLWLVFRKIMLFSIMYVSLQKTLSCILFAALCYIIFQQYY